MFTSVEAGLFSGRSYFNVSGLNKNGKHVKTYESKVKT